MTHLKIVVVSMALATLVAGLGVAARVNDGSVSANDRIEATVIKASKPVTASATDDRVVR